MQRWTGQTGVVTGASAGIGAAVCVALADAGMRVVGLARRPQLVDDLIPQVTGAGSIISRQCDVSNAEEVAAAFAWVQEECDGTAVLVNNAGVFHHGHLTELGDECLSDAAILSTIDTNFKAVVLCARHAVAHMRARNCGGHIVNINSVAGHYQPLAPTFNVYPASKHGVSAITRALLAEVAHFNADIKVTSVSPGLVETDMTSDVLASTPLPALQPADIADAVLYVLGTPPNVNISELTIHSVGEKLL